MAVSHLSTADMNHGGLSSKFVKWWLNPRTDTAVYNCRKALVWQTSRQAFPRVHRIQFLVLRKSVCVRWYLLAKIVTSSVD